MNLGPVIHEELDRIPERYRAVIVLCYLEGLTQHQAAQQLGWPLGTVQSRLARGRERLRARLARRGLDPSAAVMVLPFSSEVAQVAVLAALANSTVRLALTIAAARALAVGMVPVAVMNLTKRAIKAMFVKKVLIAGIAALLAAGVIPTGAAVYAYQAAKPDPALARPAEVLKREQPAVANSDDGLLTVTGSSECGTVPQWPERPYNRLRAWTKQCPSPVRMMPVGFSLGVCLKAAVDFM